MGINHALRNARGSGSEDDFPDRTRADRMERRKEGCVRLNCLKLAQGRCIRLVSRTDPFNILKLWNLTRTLVARQVLREDERWLENLSHVLQTLVTPRDPAILG